MTKQERFAIGIDLGGTKILAAVVDAQGKVIGKAKKATHADKGPDEVIERISKAMDEALDDAQLPKRASAPSASACPAFLTPRPAW